MWQQ
jgi:hypothetical protein